MKQRYPYTEREFTKVELLSESDNDWVLVPREATKEMQVAMRKHGQSAAAMWKAAIAARPPGGAVMQPTLGLNVSLTDDFKVIEETIDVAGQVTKRFADVRARALEEAVRTQLIALGWAPPEEARNMVDINRVLHMVHARATKQELIDWLEELKR